MSEDHQLSLFLEPPIVAHDRTGYSDRDLATWCLKRTAGFDLRPTTKGFLFGVATARFRPTSAQRRRLYALHDRLKWVTI